MASTCAVCELHAESTFKVEGMDCREEVTLLERRFKHLRGLEDFQADLMGQRLHVKYDAAQLTTAAIAAAVADAGMRAWLEHEEPIAPAAAPGWRRALLGGAALAFGAALLAQWMLASRPVAILLFSASIAGSMSLTARKAWQALRARSLDIHVLMLIAAAGAIGLGQWSEAAAVVFFFAVAQALETRTLEHARTAVRGLMDLAPPQALVRSEAGERAMPAEGVAPGAIIVIKPGEKIPLDGEVIAGVSAVNQAPVTGESLPHDKAPGDEVFAGSINGRGALDVRVTRYRKDTTLARITHLVEQAQAQRAPSQALVDRFARVYTPAVIGLAILLAVFPPLLAGASWQTWLYRSLVLLVVSCPCALVISTPVSIVAALAAAARQGVLIKGGVHLERAARVRCIAFDKTGTLTRGVPEVVGITTLNHGTDEVVVALAAAVERRSEHPIAQAIIRYAVAVGADAGPASDVKALIGQGAEGSVGGAHILVGNHRLFEARGLCTPAAHADVEGLAAKGRTPVLVAQDGVPLGVIAIADRAREAAREALALLRAHGLTTLVMLTGDSHGTAKAIAEHLGISEYHAELLPEEKVEAIATLRRQHGPVAMVGDGVNDAPALAFADLGIAMGAAGSDAALETADVALMAGDLMKLPYAMRLSRRTVSNIKANLALSLVMKGAFVVAAVAGVATLWMAVLADTGASVIVIANALRLLRTK